MSDVFILGAGFSKAISEEALPTLDKLTEDILNKVEESGEKSYIEILNAYVKKYNIDNIEDILTLLYQDFPWKPEEENSLLYSLYVFISKTIALYIEEKEANAPTDINKKRIDKLEKKSGISGELMDPNLVDFIKRIHKDKSTVITFNYDCIFDDSCRMAIRHYFDFENTDNIDCEHFYRMPIMRLFRIHKRGRDAYEGFEDTFTYNKLHGSRNWYYYGKDSDQIFLTSGSQQYIKVEEISKEALIPLIIPPVYDKSGFLKISPIRSIWVRSRRSLENAKRIFIIGYSLPPSDLTVRLMLKLSIQPDAKIFLVDTNDKKINGEYELKLRYRGIVRDIKEVDCRFLKNENVVSEFMGKYGRGEI